MSAGVRRIRKKMVNDPPRANDKLGGCWCVCTAQPLEKEEEEEGGDDVRERE